MTARPDGAGDTQMLTSLVRIHGALQAAVLPLEVAGVEALRTTRQALIDQLEDYVIPRVMTMDGPLLAVVGGSTGAGKSTLVNTLVGERVTTPGVLRPTTRSAVLVHHPGEGHWFGQDRLLPDLRRVDHASDDPTVLQLVASDKVPPGVALVDAPDVDSVEHRNRELAAQLLAAADMWLFVTSAARYADQVPWQYLREAADRSTAVAVILDRTPPDAVDTVAAHLARMLAARGLKDSPIFVVPEGPISDDGLLPASHVRDVRGWLSSLSTDTGGRSAVVKQTLDGAVRALSHHTYPLVEGVRAQVEAAAQLRAGLDGAYRPASLAAIAATTDGTLLRGEVLARWRELVGTGELGRTLDHRVGWLRERVVNAVKGKPQQAERVTVAVESALEVLVLEHAERAAAALVQAWTDLPTGEGLLHSGGPELGRASRDLRRRAEQAVRSWQDDVLDAVRAEGGERRTSPLFVAHGAQGLAVALMVLVLAGADDDTGAAEAAARVLASVVGEEAVDLLAVRATDQLRSTLSQLLESEERRPRELLDALAIVPEAAEQLRAAARRVDDARFAEPRKA